MGRAMGMRGLTGRYGVGHERHPWAMWAMGHVGHGPGLWWGYMGHGLPETVRPD